jgi:hypothetical protein
MSPSQTRPWRKTPEVGLLIMPRHHLPVRTGLFLSLEWVSDDSKPIIAQLSMNAATLTEGMQAGFPPATP